MQEKVRIQSHLQKLREECIRDYLSTKLQSIASKEVVNDILMGFLQANNKQFLENITETIYQVKTNNKKLKENIQSLKNQGKKNMALQIQKIKVQSNQQIQTLQEEFNSQMVKLMQEIAQKDKLVQKLQQNCKQLTIDNEKLSNQSNCKGEKIKQLYSHIEQINQEMISSLKQTQLLMKQQIKVCAENLENQYEAKLAKKSLQNKTLLDQKNLLIKQYQLIIQKLKISKENIEQQNNNIKKNVQAFKQQQQVKTKQIKELQREINKLAITFQKGESSFILKNQQLQQALAQLFNIQQENMYLVKQLDQIKRKKIEQIMKYEEQFKSYKTIMQKQQSQKEKLFISMEQVKIINERISFQKLCLQQKWQKKNEELYQKLAKRQQQMQVLNLLICQKNDGYKKLEEKISLQHQKLFQCQQQIKNIMRYNNIQQQQIIRLENEIQKVRDQNKCQIDTYQKTFELNVQALQQQLTQSHRQIDRLTFQIEGLNEFLQNQKTKQKYYELYIQEIALLKRELQKYQQAKDNSIFVSKSSKAKFYSLLKKINNQVRLLSRQNEYLKISCIKQIGQMKSQYDLSVKALIDEVRSNSIKCSYCQHEKKMLKTRKSPPKLMLMQKTIPKSNIDGNVIKRNLKQIQQRYQLLNHQNESFSNRVDSILNKNS